MLRKGCADLQDWEFGGTQAKEETCGKVGEGAMSDEQLQALFAGISATWTNVRTGPSMTQHEIARNEGSEKGKTGA
jgi:hypothetical protein